MITSKGHIMKTIFKKLIPLCIVTTLLATFCKPSHAALTGTIYDISPQWWMTPEQEITGSSIDVTVTNYFYLRNTGSADGTVTSKGAATDSDEDASVSGIRTKDVLVPTGGITTYDSHSYTFSGKTNYGYTCEAQIVEKAFPTHILDEKWTTFPVEP
jgi:hypothetical protein